MQREIADRELEMDFLAALVRFGQSSPPKARTALELSNVTADSLYYPEHRDIINAVVALLKADKFPDMGSLWALLKSSQPVFSELGGLPGLAEMLERPGGSKLIPQHGQAIQELHARRQMVRIAGVIASAAQDQKRTTAEALEEAQQSLAAVTVGKRELRTCLTMLEECVDEMEEVWSGKRDGALRTGLPSLDTVIGGLQPTLIVIGALPGVGKSALLASIVSNVARSGAKVGVFSLEDEGKWLTWRFLARDSGVSQFVLRNRQLVPSQQQRVAEAFDALKAYAGNVIVDDRSCLTPDEVVQESRHMIINHGVRAIFVDHAGELRFSGQHQDRHDLELADALSSLRGIAKTHSVPIVVFAHLRRRQGLEPGDEPRLSDFANSSAFERKARIALGLSRVPGSDTMNVTLLKQTNGATSFMTARGETTNTIQLEFVGLDAMVRDIEGAVSDPYSEQQEDMQ